MDRVKCRWCSKLAKNGGYCSSKCKVSKQKYDKEYAAKHREERAAYYRKWRFAHPKRCRELRENWRNRNREKARESVRRFQRNLRLEIVTAYGGKCECCGEKVLQFLTIDHINNDGAKERRSTGGNKFLVSIKRRGFPKNLYRLLCWNCNSGRAINGGICPHKE